MNWTCRTTDGPTDSGITVYHIVATGVWVFLAYFGFIAVAETRITMMISDASLPMALLSLQVVLAVGSTCAAIIVNHRVGGSRFASVAFLLAPALGGLFTLFILPG